MVFDEGDGPDDPSTSTLNDGFSIGRVTVEPIPLPAAGLLLLGAVGALVVVRRARRKAADA